MNEVQARNAAREAVRTGTVVGTATARALAYFWTDGPDDIQVWAMRAYAQTGDEMYLFGMHREAGRLLDMIDKDEETDGDDNYTELKALRDYAASMLA